MRTAPGIMLLAAWLLAAATAGPALAGEDKVSFATDVQPILTRLGCNQGACHGAQHGKGSFKLSLRGFDDAADHREIVAAGFGRRVSAMEPADSLLLRKPTLGVPHEGGRRLDPHSPAYDTLVRWLRQGTPGPSASDRKPKALVVEPKEVVLRPGGSARIVARATYEDGSSEDLAGKAAFDSQSPTVASVSADGEIHAAADARGEAAIMVRYLSSVAATRVIVPYGPAPSLDAFRPNNLIDTLWADAWRKVGLAPSPTCDDAEFFRRIHLGTLATLPRPEDVRAFLADTSPDRREKAIDAVLARPEYAAAWAHKWGDLLLNSSQAVGKKGMWSLHNWLLASFRANRPMDELVAELLTAVGSPYQNGPANFYKIGDPDEWTETASQVFLGVRLQCAKCHNHPYESILQADYYAMKAFFGRVGKKQSREFGLGGGDTVVFVRDGGEVRHPRTGQVMKPKPIGGAPIDDPIDRRRALAAWITAKDNRALARNLVNRYWGYYFGRGLVNPIDDMRATNPASNPQLLDALADDLAAHQYDIKHLMRTIMRSRVYQLDAVALPANRADVENRYVTHFAPTRLGAEALLDAVDAACGTREKFAGLPSGYRAIDLPDSDYASEFLDTFGRPRRAVPCECERSGAPTMTQALLMISGGLLNRKVADPKGRAATLAAAKAPPAKAVEELFLCTVSRPPTAEETKEAVADIAAAGSPKEGLEDLLWTLLNTREFQFNH
ncbi:hypothetical protein OJF2_77910 [Aquisphaera giovannonii]|uniref:Bacterial Ig-like domain (Group 2) n=1 Tax=Aquisphaera giovannonii TaxID=406548 RepID=A0A5B9WFX9_9BACT|nr:DUF1553 domain-containing protein [Aquisphaera giovannonii]QEH39179.1 hypothetical protein OJF2_77910 [Aquisphaera giovannonii]